MKGARQKILELCIVATNQQRVCYIHVGTHKTGSSAIQWFIMHNADALGEMGVLVPRMGFDTDFLQGGHANIARELSGDVLFNARFGTVERALTVIDNSGMPTVVLTSELFEFLHDRPLKMAPLIENLRRIGYEPKAILYLRSRIAYIESLYVQMLRSGFDCPFDEYLDYVLKHGEYVSTDGFTHFQFEYAKVLSGFEQAFGRGNVIVKRYGERFGSGFLFDFLDTIGCPSDERRGVLKSNVSTNSSLSFREALELLYDNAKTYAGAHQPNPEALLRELFGEELGFVDDSFTALDQRDIARLIMRFGRDSVTLASEYGFTTVPSVPLMDPISARKRRAALRAGAAAWRLADYRTRCHERSAGGMLPTNILQAAAAMECR